MPAQPFEVISTEDKEQFPTQHGSTLQAYELTAKNQAGEPLLIKINRKPTNPPPSPGETIWLETWETEYGLKGKKAQGPRTQTSLAPGGDSRDRSIVRQHSQHMALQFASLVNVPTDDAAEALRTIEAWTDHFDADVDKATGSPPSQPSNTTSTSNGEAKITEAQITNFILKRQKMYGISDEDMALLVKSFGVEKLKDLPRSKVDAFAAAMPNPIPNGESDVPSEHETPASDDDSRIPF